MDWERFVDRMWSKQDEETPKQVKYVQSISHEVV
ncbi:hypothetical protein MSWAN_1684 [Methanobacterium paludis]|uniref:Uncharacterized protein n=1 Tax=Methanobacterium paludis (strain DSM 25820 / JCM 18151 / SWAN1) TaxID=868131 RepID=F6D3A3_METPW|nr:hypothetical protein MSWAN_1684 [Methanobacterium paludis]